MIRLIIFFVAGLMFSSCSSRLTPFTQELYERNNWSEDELKSIQFYLSDDIVMSREVTRGETTISEGKIRLVNGKRVEQIVIQEGTPGVLIFMPKKDRLAISFENSDELFLMFGPNPKIQDRYALLAKEWRRQGGKVHYNNKLYNVDANGAISSLLVDLKRIGEVDYKSRKAEGRTVN